MLPVEHNLAASSILFVIALNLLNALIIPLWLLPSLDWLLAHLLLASWLLTVTSLGSFVGSPYPAPAWSILAKPTDPREEPGNPSPSKENPRPSGQLQHRPYPALPAITSNCQPIPQALSTQSLTSPGVKLIEARNNHHSPLKV